ncbi:SH2 domain-containing protein 2A [Phaenicophaeus curvirostris]|uniref:SH2 domain-containing protein 2A n=1 Tax=Phaenicophaeus curvirostris TaxID=33595 RepID=UPI0037F0C5AA
MRTCQQAGSACRFLLIAGNGEEASAARPLDSSLVGPRRGDPMGDDHPLFSTSKPTGEDKASTKMGPNTHIQPRGAEQTLEHGDTHLSPRLLFASLQVPPGCSSPELVALRAQTRLWFKQTQARRLGAEGELPPWFHGFISRRETEQLLQDQPRGCFLVRFSESTVGFVLSYRGRDRCRHFVLDQLPDGRYVILGEQSAHAELAELLRHYSTEPITPYREFLTVPCRRQQDEPQGATRTPAVCSPSSKVNLPAYGIVVKRPSGARNPAKGGASTEASSVPPPLPAKSSSLAAALGPHGPTSSGAAAEGACAQGHQGAVLPEPPVSPQLADAKYQELLCFHTYAEPHEGITTRSSTYAEPHEGITTSPSIYCELQEPIPFYAMGWGSSPRAGPKENIYSEAAPALPRGSRGAFSTLPPKPHAQRRLFRSVSSQAFKKQQLPAAPSGDGKERGASSKGTTTNPLLEFDDPVYGWRTRATERAPAAAGREGPENIYEQLSGDHP